ncbi:maleate cis-trans isomerase family protein [Actinomadura montaniterrae]|nr:Asp/Glu racemase [Actinomadura montaniterrae]
MPRLLGRHADAQFSFHSTRMRMRAVSAAELRAMNAQRERCVIEVADADPEVILYACLVALMAGGPGEHRRVESLVAEQLATGDSAALVRSSAGALVEGLKALGARRIGLVMPYLRPLAEQVVSYLEHEGFTIADWRALEVGDNTEVGCIPGARIMAAARSMELEAVDALVLSCCVQMPSLDLIEPAEQEFGIPVLSAATAAAYSILRALRLPIAIPGAGGLLRADEKQKEEVA